MGYYIAGSKIRPQMGRIFIILVVLGTTLATTLFYRLNTFTAAAVTPPDSCFAFSAGTITDYYDNQNNDGGQPACPKNVDIPGTIDGTPVTTIGADSFSGSGVTALALPTSINVIETGAFGGLSLTDLHISTIGDLLIDNGAFGGTSLTASALTIEATGNLEVLNSFSGPPSAVSGTILLHSGGDLHVTNGFMAGATIGEVKLTADTGSILLDGGGFSSATVGQVSIDAGTDITASGGTIDSASGLNMQAGRDIIIDSGAFSNNNMVGSLVIDAGRTVSIDGAMSAGGFTDIEVTAVNNIVLGETVFGSQTSLTTATLTSTAGAIRVTSAFYGDTSLTLTSLTLQAADGLYVDRGFLGANPDLEVILDINGDVVIENSSFTNSQLDSFDIDTTGSITVDDTTFGGIGYIKSVDWRAGNDITLIGPLEGGGSSSWWGNQYYSGFTTAINLQAGNNLTVGNRIFAEVFNLDSLSLHAGGAASFGDNVFSYGQLSNLTLPAGTTSIGEYAFSFNNIDAVHLQGSTPTIGDYAFSFSGVTTVFPPESTIENPPVNDFENVQYVQLYTDALAANPGGYTHTAYPATTVTLSDDSDLERPAGGYIVNPATYTVNYESPLGDTLAPQFISGTGPTLTDYLIATNPAANFSLYYLADDLVTLSAPDIDSYLTPSEYNLELDAGPNAYTFTYTLADVVDDGDSDNNGDSNDDSLADTGWTWLGFMVVSGLVVSTSAITIIKFTRRQL